jgi:hypothetical protein
MNNSTGKLKWTDGSLNERTNKNDKDKYINNNINESEKYESNKSNECLMEMDSRLFRQPVEDLKMNNRKEEHNQKFLEREQIANINLNPFMINSNYVEDLVNRDTFLIPKDSNFK